MPDLLTLDDPRVALATGSKAAGLARALHAGSPVLPGWVVPSDVLQPLREAGTTALEAGGPAAAQLAVSGCRLDPDVVAAVRAISGRFPHGAVIRSATPLDSDPSFSGAFATYHEVGSADVSTALHGCVASLFTRDALMRCLAAGITPADVGLEILVQRWIPFDHGGIATVGSDGDVRVVTVEGGPAALVGGRRTGVVATVDPDEGLREGGPDPSQAETLRQVARVARQALIGLGAGSIEWGTHNATVWLLQVRPTPSRAVRMDEPVLPKRTSMVERRAALLAANFPGPLGEAEVMPWAIALDRIPRVPRIGVEDPARASREARAIAAELRSQVWRLDPDAASSRWRDVARSLLAGEVDAVVPRVERLRPPDPANAAKVLALWRGVGDRLAANGVLVHPEQIWRTTPSLFASSLEGGVTTMPHGPDRWEVFVAAVAASAGMASNGEAVAAGLGAGRVHRLVTGAARPGPRAVIVAQRPVPQIAPLLWGCAGLVTVEGSDGAHLFEVARSLGVPAVTSPGFGERGIPPSGTVAAVDGYAGSVAVLPDASGIDELVEIGA